MWPSEPGVDGMLILILLPLGAAIMIGIGYLIEKIRERGRGRKL